MAPGCGKPVRENIVGSWVLDLEATKALPHFRAMAEEQRNALFKNLDGMTLEVTITQNTLSKQSSVHMLEGLDQMKASMNGTYIVNRAKGNTVVLAVQTSEGMQRVGIELKEDGRIVLDMDESKTVLRRK
jgi:hypothetical protein